MPAKNVLILTYGSRGDVEPFIALALGMQAAGYSVSLATAERFGDWVKGFGIPFHPITGAALALIDSPEAKTMIEGTGGRLGVAMAGIRMMRKAGPSTRQMMHDAWAAAQSANPDLIVFHPKILAAPHIAEKLRVPAAMATLQPLIVPTSAFPASLPAIPIPGYNRLSYALVPLAYRTFRKSANAFREGTLGLPPVNAGREILMPKGAGTIPVLHAFSPTVLPRPDDWSDHAHITGYWRLQDDNTYEPPPKLAAFLDGGPPPVFVGFGSMTSRDPKTLGRIVVQALRRADQRGIVATGWAGLEVEESDEIISTPAVPYRWLFPRMAAVVHHGGAGTTAEGFCAGVPSVICPFFADQPFWAARSVTLRVGARPVPRKKLTPDRLARSIMQAVHDPRLRTNAQVLAAKLRNEDGVATAVETIERSINFN